MENRAELSMRQAGMRAHEYMIEAIRDIDGEFGEGFARAHPELVGAYMRTAAADFAATFQADRLEEIGDSLEGISNNLVGGASGIADAIREWRVKAKSNG